LNDLTQPPPHRRPTKRARVAANLDRIEKALRLGWRMAEIKETLAVELELGEVSVDTFKKMVATARARRAAAPAPTAQAAPAVQAVPAPVAPASPPPSPANSVTEKMALLRADHARRAAAQAAELAAEAGGVAPVAVAVAPAPVAVPAPAAVVAAPVAPVVRAAPVPAPAQKPAAAGTLTRSEKLAQMRALQLAAPEPTDPTLIAALRVRKRWLKPDDSIVAKAAVEGLQKVGAILCQPFEIGGASVPAKHFRETAAEYLKAVPQARLLIEESIVEHQAFWDADKPYVERTDAQIHENLVTAIKLGYADRLRAAEAKPATSS